MAFRSIGVAERRARLGVRHHLATSAVRGDLVAVCGDLVGLHATDPASVFLASAARIPQIGPETIESVLYDERALVRISGVRSTMFVVPLDLAAVVRAAATRAGAARARRQTIRLLERGGITSDAEPWLAEAEQETLNVLRDLGTATSAELSKAQPWLREQIVYLDGKPFGGPQIVTTRVLGLLFVDGRIMRAKPSGSWTSTQVRWVPTDAWLPDGLPELPTEPARADLARRWLATFGPARIDDLKWWTGWSLRSTRSALAQLDVAEVDLDGTPGLVLASPTLAGAVGGVPAGARPVRDGLVVAWAFLVPG